MTDQEITEAEIIAKRNAYASVFSGDAGKMVMADIEKFCGFNNSSVTTKPIDPYQVIYNEGLRRVCLRIKGMIKEGKL